MIVPGVDLWFGGKNPFGRRCPPVAWQGPFFKDFEHVPFQKNMYIEVSGIKNEKDAHRNLAKIGGI